MKQLDLTPFFKTKTQAVEFSTRLSNVMNHLYDVDFNLEKMLTDTIGLQKKDKFIALLRENDIPVDKMSALKDFFQSIIESIATLPLLEMTIGFEPKEQTLSALAEWFVMNLKRQVLISFTIDKSVIAGAKINFNGKFLDASIKPIFEKTLTEMFPAN